MQSSADSTVSDPLSEGVLRSRDPAPVYLASFIAIGISLSIIGPALSILRAQTGSSLAGIGVLFLTQGTGYMLGGFFAGRGYDAGFGHRQVATALFLIAAIVLTMPYVHSLSALAALCAVNGAVSGVIDVGGNTLVIWVRQGNVGPTMNLLHLSFALGALATPLLTAIGLLTVTRIEAAVAIVVAVAALSYPSPRPVHLEKASTTRAPRRLLMIVAVFFILYVGLEAGFGGWIHTYGEEIGFSKNAAAGLTATFWGSFAIGRLLASAVARRTTARLMITTTCAMALAAALAMVIGNGRVVVVWPATALFGISVASQFPMMMTFADERLRVSGSDMSWFIAGAGIGGLTLPWLIGQFFDAHGAKAMPIAVSTFGVATLAWFLFTAHALERHLLVSPD